MGMSVIFVDEHQQIAPALIMRVFPDQSANLVAFQDSPPKFHNRTDVFLFEHLKIPHDERRKAVSWHYVDPLRPETGD